MQRLDVSGTVRLIYESLGVKRLTMQMTQQIKNLGCILSPDEAIKINFFRGIV